MSSDDAVFANHASVHDRGVDQPATGGGIAEDRRDVVKGEAPLLALEGGADRQRDGIEQAGAQQREKETEEDALPPPPQGGQWVGEKALATLDLLPGVRRLCAAALAAIQG